MKVWKRAMKPVQGLTLCGKRINQYCDQDRDKKVSITEWTVCLDVASGKNCLAINSISLKFNVSDPDAETQFRRKSSHTPDISQRRGPNPLKTWLKEED